MSDAAAVLTDEELKAKAEELGVDVSAFDAPEFPDFKDEAGYLLQITGAETVVSPKGASQACLSVVALDEEFEQVRRAKSKLWLTFPFDTANFKFKDTDAHERAYNDMRAILLDTGGETERALYSEWFTKVSAGNKTHYYDREGNELLGPAWKEYKKHRRINVLTSLRRLERDPKGWVGLRFYAQRKYVERDGQTYRNWQRITSSPHPAVAYIFEPAHMLSRPNGSGQKDHGEDLF